MAIFSVHTWNIKGAFSFFTSPFNCDFFALPSQPSDEEKLKSQRFLSTWVFCTYFSSLTFLAKRELPSQEVNFCRLRNSSSVPLVTSTLANKWKFFSHLSCHPAFLGCLFLSTEQEKKLDNFSLFRLWFGRCLPLPYHCAAKCLLNCRQHGKKLMSEWKEINCRPKMELESISTEMELPSWCDGGL